MSPLNVDHGKSGLFFEMPFSPVQFPKQFSPALILSKPTSRGRQMCINIVQEHQEWEIMKWPLTFMYIGHVGCIHICYLILKKCDFAANLSCVQAGNAVTDTQVSRCWGLLYKTYISFYRAFLVDNKFCED